jgi:hypothetical protein
VNASPRGTRRPSPDSFMRWLDCGRASACQ